MGAQEEEATVGGGLSKVTAKTTEVSVSETHTQKERKGERPWTARGCLSRPSRLPGGGELQRLQRNLLLFNS